MKPSRKNTADQWISLKRTGRLIGVILVSVPFLSVLLTTIPKMIDPLVCHKGVALKGSVAAFQGQLQSPLVDQGHKDEIYSSQDVSKNRLNTVKDHATEENATRAYFLSDGAEMFENVCIFQMQGTVKGAIHSYSADGKSMALLKRYTSDKVTHMLANSAGKTLEQWADDSRRGVLVEEETLLFASIYHNPAHCLHDNALSMAIDLQDRNNGRAIMPFYKKYFHIDLFDWKSLPGCPAYEDPVFDQMWCCAFMATTGLINVANSIKYNEQESPICFRKLIVPSLTAFRLLPGEKAVESLRELRKMAFKGLSSNITASPWDSESLPEDVPILFYDRHGSSRRILTNSDELRDKLEERYHVNIHHLGKDFDKLTFTEQAVLFNKSPRIITPHGGHLANLLFTRPGTKSMEIACPDKIWKSPNPPNNNLTSLKDARNDVEWYGDARFFGRRWFACLARPLFIEYFMYEEFDGCKEEFRLTKGFVIDVEAFLPFVETRFGLKKRRRDIW